MGFLRYVYSERLTHALADTKRPRDSATSRHDTEIVATGGCGMRPDPDDALFEMWARATEPETAPWVIKNLKVPGSLAMRCRYELLADGNAAVHGPEAFLITRTKWDQQTTLVTQGDDAIDRFDLDAAEVAFTRLRASHDGHEFPLALIDGEIGLGQVAHHRERPELAVKHLTTALTFARSAGYLYAQVRASIVLGEMLVASGSAKQAHGHFLDALLIAAERDWRIDEANALIGVGHALERLRLTLSAMQALLDAFEIFESIGAQGGLANAALLLGDVCRREGWSDDAAGWYRQAAAFAHSSRTRVAEANAWDGLGETLLALGDWDEAAKAQRRAYELSAEYPRGRAHSALGLGRVAFARGEIDEARDWFSEALDGYLGIDDLASAANSYESLARVELRTGDVTAALDRRWAAVASIEQIRAAQPLHDHQGEYFRRYRHFYHRAMTFAIEASNLELFVATFEAIAGRRLASLLASTANPEEARLLAGLVQEADSQARLLPLPKESVDNRRQVVQAMGNLAARSALPDLAARALEDVVAATYRPFDRESASEIWDNLGSAPVLAVALLDDSSDLAWMLRGAATEVHVGLHKVDSETASLIKDLARVGLPAMATPDLLGPLGALLPAELVDLIITLDAITIVPAGNLWAVPWLALPISDGSILGELLPITVMPSLTLAATLAAPARKRPIRVGVWRSPSVRAHKIRGFTGVRSVDEVLYSSASEAKRSLLLGDVDLAVIVAHGTPRVGLVHALELDDDTTLVPAELLLASPPAELVLISCWGARVPAQEGDPLSLATLAVLRGTTSAIASTSEIADDGSATLLVNMLLKQSAAHELPIALHLALRRWLSHSEHRQGYLSRWAPLIAIGTLQGGTT